MPRLAATLATLAALALAAAPVAWGHGGTDQPHVDPVIAAVDPEVPGFEAVIDDAGKLRLTNTTGKDAVLQGQHGEPYLRLRGGGGVDVNLLSRTTYTNREPVGRVTLPGLPDPDAKPRWQQVGDGKEWEIDDARLHYTRPLPAAVTEHPGDPRDVASWRLVATVGDEPVAIRGVLQYEPAPSNQLVGRLVLLAFPAITLVALLLGYLHARRRQAARLAASRPPEPSAG